MYSPKKTKYIKYQKKFVTKIKYNNTLLKFGKFGLKALQSGLITAKTIEAVRRAITRKFKRNGKVWINVFPNFPITKKPLEVRMGKGKGNVYIWVSKVQAGQIVFEMDGISLQLATLAYNIAYKKLPIKTALVCN